MDIYSLYLSYQAKKTPKKKTMHNGRTIGFGLLALLLGVVSPFIPISSLHSVSQAQAFVRTIQLFFQSILEMTLPHLSIYIGALKLVGVGFVVFLLIRGTVRVFGSRKQKRKVKQDSSISFTLSSDEPKSHKKRHSLINRRAIGLILILLSFGGILRPLLPTLLAEASYQKETISANIQNTMDPPQEMPKSVPVIFDPLFDQTGNPITPVNTDFSVIVPKVGINAPVIANVNPGKEEEYDTALMEGVAHASTSFLPDQNGTVFLFSHSTNYEWYVKDLNAVFYAMKNVEEGDWIVIMYQNTRYTYKVTKKEVVKPTDTSYLNPTIGNRTLILQTCWPPGSTTERLLVFAELFEAQKVSQ